MTHPYDTAALLARPVPPYISEKAGTDQARVRAYWTYDDMYFNHDQAYAALLREDQDPKGARHIPYARAIVEGINRYLGKGLTITYEIPADSGADEVAQAELATWVEGLFTREAFPTKFAELKRQMLRRGDSFLLISADPSKEEGKRLRLTVLDGSQYFAIPFTGDSERVAGCYIVTLLTSPDGSTIVAQREWYQRILTVEDQAKVPGSTIGGIYYKIDFFEQNGWDDRAPLTKDDLKPAPPPDWIAWSEGQQLAWAGFMLPAQITSLPVYHFPNTFSEPYGFSVLQGLETILAGITQGTSDEDTAIALSGIGVFWTDSGSPRTADGKETDWVVAPGSVMELNQGRKFGRVEGVTTVEPMQDHIDLLKGDALEAAGVPDVALGRVEVAVAESGVALAIRMGPITAANREREIMLLNKIMQFLHDLLNGWAPAYEGRQPIEGVFKVNATFEDPMPIDRAAVLKEITDLVEAKIIDVEYAVQLLRDKLGYNIPADMVQRMATAAQSALDAEGKRLDAAAAGLDAGGVE